MEFRFEDILKNVIPGSVLLTAITLFLLGGSSFQDVLKTASELKDHSAIILVAILIGCYFFGYMNDALSSFLEYHFVHRLFGRPSYRLLTGKTERFRLINYKAIIDNVKTKFPNDSSLIFSNDKAQNKKVAVSIFKYANILKIQNDKAEVMAMVKENYYSYVFSRNLFFSVLVSTFLLIIRYYQSMIFGYYVLLFLIILLLAFRRRERDYYNTRYILIASNF